MSKEDQFVTKRQLKAITVHGNRHSSTITGNALGIFPEPLNLPATEVKKDTSEESKTDHDLVENMIISIDLDVKEISHHDGFIEMLMGIVGINKVEKNFEVISTAEKTIRAMAKAKFKNIATIVLNNEVIYNQPEDFYDIDKGIEQLIQTVHDKNSIGNNIFIRLLSEEHKDCIVEVKVSRVHLPWVHDILIKFKGVLPDEYFRRVINYLEDHLEIEDIESRWNNA
jgi:hypothetical protein